MSAIPKEGRNSKKATKKISHTVWDSKEKALEIAKGVLGKKGEDVALLYVGELSTLADYYLICSASSEPHIWAIVDSVETLLQKNKLKPFGIEGRKGSSWVLVDCGNVIVHIFTQESRAFYHLDGLWADAPRIDLSVPTLIRAPTVRKRKAKT